MKKVGEYEWRQLSMWDFAPKNCVETYIKSQCGKHVFHYYLQRIKEVVSDNHWKVETVEDISGVPEEVLNWRNGDYKLRVDGKRV